MEDLISRQTAINELMKKNKHLRSLNWNKYKTADYECVGVDECIDIIANLPSAQPEKAQLSEEGTTSDCISRQVAIDEIMKELKDRSLHDDGETSEDFADGYDEGIRNAATRVYLMPSTQPEIIHCKDCIWYELPSHKITENCVRWMKSNGILLPIKPDDFCSRAERRTDER